MLEESRRIKMGAWFSSGANMNPDALAAPANMNRRNNTARNNTAGSNNMKNMQMNVQQKNNISNFVTNGANTKKNRNNTLKANAPANVANIPATSENEVIEEELVEAVPAATNQTGGHRRRSRRSSRKHRKSKRKAHRK